MDICCTKDRRANAGSPKHLLSRGFLRDHVSVFLSVDPHRIFGAGFVDRMLEAAVSSSSQEAEKGAELPVHQGAMMSTARERSADRHSQVSLTHLNARDGMKYSSFWRCAILKMRLDLFGPSAVFSCPEVEPTR